MTTPPFAGFPKEAVPFLAALAKNNRREWFQAHREEFDRHVRAPMEAIVTAINGALSDLAPAYVTEPRASIFRIHRDVRFSKDKSPYKTQVAAHFPRDGGAPDEVAGFYVALSPRGLDVGGGTYVPGPVALDRLRRHVAEHGDELESLASSRTVVRAFGPMDTAALRGMPRGWPKDHPRADLLRMTRAFFMTTLPPALVTTPRLFREVRARLELLAPFVEHLDVVLAGTRARR